MARTVTTSLLWGVVCLQFAFFLILSTLYVWKEYSTSKGSAHRCLPNSCQSRRLSSNVGARSAVKKSIDAVYTRELQPKQKHRQRKLGTQLHTKNFDYTLNPAANVCGSPVYLLVIVESTVYNAMERDYFRKRWKTNEYNNKTIATVFVAAKSDLEEAQELLLHEYEQYKDILQIDFEDSYRNLTLKTMMSLRWAIDECQLFQYLMKTDDDMIVNFDVLINQLEQLPTNITQDLYTGLMMSRKRPIRDTGDKWHVTVDEYPHDKYPEYMGGPGYVLSHSAVNRVIDASYQLPFMPMEDVFVGICVEKAGIQGYSNLRFSNWEIWDYYSYCWAREMITLHKADFNVRELYYFDKFINSHKFNFQQWGREDLLDDMMYAQKKANKLNNVDEFIGYPMVYKCSPTTWTLEKDKCMYKHLVQWKISRHKIIDI